MEDRRVLERFPLQLAASVCPLGRRQGGNALHLFTRDISAGGAFFCAPGCLKRGSQVTVELSMMLRAARQMANLTVQGSVVRVEHDGMAVAFDPAYQLAAVDFETGGGPPSV